MDPFVHNVTWWYLVIGFCIGVGIWFVTYDDHIDFTTRTGKWIELILKILVALWVADLIFWALVGLTSAK